ncbi:fibronectin type III domain-containing protein [Luteolibacter luteus]|uniref:Fibronectin type III domain-containing protein n=1 Tax=Luteolibacter luteus TaxID=2728835 RepID=A0A858RGA6_9BACT|nr:fibronectin type III domain-containing protein [Luteolibacter luteus]QJE95578.1 fibronectin type III domain-containing protein [Luteolibacter luteus]
MSLHFLFLATFITLLLAPRGNAQEGWQIGMHQVPKTPTKGLVHANGLWVGVGLSGKIITSPDGVAWTCRPVLTRQHLNTVIHANGRFVACGDNGALLTSTDGIAWEIRNSGSTFDLRDIAYGTGVFVVTGTNDGSGDAPLFLTSSDLLNWTAFDTAGKFTTNSLLADAAAIVFANGQFVVPFPNQQTFVSSDGLSWERKLTNLDFDFPRDITYDSGKFYCLSLWGTCASSLDALTWTPIILTQHSTFERMDRILVDGSRMILTSDDAFHTSTSSGEFWSKRAISSPSGNDGLFGVARNGSRYIVMGFNGSAIVGDNFLWQAVYTSPAVENFFGVHHAADTFVAVGKRDDFEWTGVIWSSPDALHWSLRHAAPGHLNSVCHGNGTWVCVGEAASGDATLFTSTDLTNWTERPNPSNYNLKDVIFANGVFVAVGGSYGSPMVLTSPDGIAWTARTSNARGILAAVTYGNGLFVAVGERESGNAGEIISSPDGVTWTRADIEPPAALTGIIYADSMFLAGGSSGYRSSDGLAWTPLDNLDGGSSGVGGDMTHDGSRFINASSTTITPLPAQGTLKVTPQHGFAGLSICHGEGKTVIVGGNQFVRFRNDGDLPAAPAGVAAESSTVTWLAHPAARGYQLYHRQAGTHQWFPSALPCSPSESSRLIKGLLPLTGYEFAVQAITDAGLSELATASSTTFHDLDLWRMETFGSRDGEGDGADDADPDHDGYGNLVEYALGGNPFARDPRKLVTTSSDLVYDPGWGGWFNFEVSFVADARKKAIDIHVEASTDLVNWEKIARSKGGAPAQLLGDTGEDFGFYDGYSGGASNPVREIIVSRSGMLPFTPENGKTFFRIGVEEAAP